MPYWDHEKAVSISWRPFACSLWDYNAEGLAPRKQKNRWMGVNQFRDDVKKIS